MGDPVNSSVFSDFLNCVRDVDERIAAVRLSRRDVAVASRERSPTNFYARQHICYSAYMLWQFRLSVRLSVRPSRGWISQKRLKLGSRNFHHTVAPCL